MLLRTQSFSRDLFVHENWVWRIGPKKGTAKCRTSNWISAPGRQNTENSSPWKICSTKRDLSRSSKIEYSGPWQRFYHFYGRWQVFLALLLIVRTFVVLPTACLPLPFRQPYYFQYSIKKIIVIAWSLYFNIFKVFFIDFRFATIGNNVNGQRCQWRSLLHYYTRK